MSNTILEISRKHGREMYILGLEHAIKTIESRGNYALKHLKDQLEREKKELENE